MFFFIYRFAHFRGLCLHKCGCLHILRVKCLHIWGWNVCTKCGRFLIKKTMICTFVGCLYISRQNWSFAHLTASCLHISGWYIFFTYMHIWGRSVCTNVVVCTFQGKMFAQMWLFAHLWVFAHFTAPQGGEEENYSFEVIGYIIGNHGAGGTLWKLGYLNPFLCVCALWMKHQF